MRIRHVKGAEEAVEKSPYVINEPTNFKGNWKKEIFGNENPLYLEVGMGMGRFIRTHALENPGINFIGFEINTTVLYKSLKRYEALLSERGREGSLANLRFIRQDARFLCDDFSEDEIDRIYLNFSDPWPKDKNANKRLTSPVFLKLYEKILKPEGRLEFKTDNRGLFEYSLESVPAAGWEITEKTFDLHNDEKMRVGNVMTEYEEKFSGKGNPIFKLTARKKAI